MRIEAIRFNVSFLLTTDAKSARGSFGRSASSRRTWRIVRRPPQGVSRQLDHVSLIEIGNAMIVVAEQTGGIGEEDIKREALNLLGSRRVTQAVGVRLGHALSAGLKRGVLQQSGSGLIVSE